MLEASVHAWRSICLGFVLGRNNRLVGGGGRGGVGWAAAESDLPPPPYFGRRSVFGGATGVFLSTIHTWARGVGGRGAYPDVSKVTPPTHPQRLPIKLHTAVRGKTRKSSTKDIFLSLSQNNQSRDGA